ncbi:hypothetical protein K469DRAFT_683087 [Zopfia rhizophila CBS 207.26]|uniref:Arrestin-like N-terminal domain-containing protein n=1 Tax=Zopfia rhizophila CBS 207.26 TaxID=1314779 RepID=A0A6A6EF50_9PEZI|nr:hypothetical protein K469DRAFT_683087 [Zopfia rhizophila CBS 207.26]
MAPLEPSLRVIVDDDSSRVYRHGDEVNGKVILVVENEEQIKALTVNFIGACITKTTRPFYVSRNDGDAPSSSRQEFRERTFLFNLEKVLLPAHTLGANKYSWAFDFTFPELTETRHSRWAHGSKYLKGPHPLPPSFHTYTNNPGGQAMISYFIQAKLTRGGMRGAVRTTQMLAYHPSPRPSSLEPKMTSRALYAQTWKPMKDPRKAIDKVLTKVSRKSGAQILSPRIVPTLHFPEKVAPGQPIHLLLSINNARRQSASTDNEQPECMLDSLNVVISTFTTTICGKPLTQPQDAVTKHVTCISRQNINQSLSFDTPAKLTNNFRLVDDAESVPTFKTYTISRRYEMSVVIGIKCLGQKFTIESTTPLEILPRNPHALMVNRPEEQDDIPADPLPLYAPREPSTELAPGYNDLYSPSTGASTPYSLMETDGYGLASGSSTPPTGSMTSPSELDLPNVPESAEPELEASKINRRMTLMPRAAQHVSPKARRRSVN